MHKKGVSGIVVILIIASVVGFFAIGGKFSSLSGFTTLSLSQASFTSSAPTQPDSSGCSGIFNGQAWILTVAQGGMGQHAEGYFNGAIPASDITQKSGTQAVNNFKISADYAVQQCEYPIKRIELVPEDEIRNYYLKESSTSIFYAPHCDQAQADAICGKDKWVLYGALNTRTMMNCYCLQADPVARVIDNTLADVRVRTKSTITVSNGIDSPTTAQVDTLGSSRGCIGPNVYYTWVGDLSTGQYCPSMTDYFAYATAVDNVDWHIGNLNAYNRYKTGSEQLRTTILACGTNEQCMITTLNALARDRDAAMAEPWGTNIQDKGSLDSAILTKEINTFSNIPLYTFYVKAAWLGIYQPHPSVEILLPVADVTIKTNGNMQANIRNNGDGGNVRYWVTCSDSRFTGGTSEIYVNKGETKQITLPLYVNVAAQATSVCTLHINDVFSEKTANFNVIGKPEVGCNNPGQLICGFGGQYNNKIIRCNDAGSGWDIFKDCNTESKTCAYDANNQPYCKATNSYCDEHPTDPQCTGECAPILGFIPDIPCMIGKWWATYGTSIIIILILLAAVAFMFMMRK